MFEYKSLFIIYFLLVAMATVLIYHAYMMSPIVRGRIESDWTSASEGAGEGSLLKHSVLVEGFATQRVARPSSSAMNEGFRGSDEKTAALLTVAPDPQEVAGKFVDMVAGEPVKRDDGPYTLLTNSDCVTVVDKVRAADKGPWAEGGAGNEPNSEDCYRHNYQACVNSVGGSYAQMTNNYKRNNPDSCSSPFHEFLGNFYRP